MVFYQSVTPTPWRQIQHQPQRIEIRAAAVILPWIRHLSVHLAATKMTNLPVASSKTLKLAMSASSGPT
jgi:hypothetical protein